RCRGPDGARLPRSTSTCPAMTATWWHRCSTRRGSARRASGRRVARGCGTGFTATFAREHAICADGLNWHTLDWTPVTTLEQAISEGGIGDGTRIREDVFSHVGGLQTRRG